MQPFPSERMVPLIVATALFMENMDSTVIATSLPAIAQALSTDPLALKLAVTSYLLSLAICIPASGWTADRFGTRNVFRAAIAVFVLGPICGPPLGGFITTYASWHWIFLINVPIGVVGMALASRYIPNIRVERPDPFDYIGFVLSGCAIAGLAFGLSAIGLEFLPTSI